MCYPRHSGMSGSAQFGGSFLTIFQQIYISALWLWGSTLSKLAQGGTNTSNLLVTKPVVVLSAGASVALLMWAIGGIIFFGLPDYYRQNPGTIPSFIPS